MSTWPEAFETQTKALLGPDFSAFLAALASEPPVSLRINPSKLQWAAPLPASQKIPWCPTGLYLPKRPIFTLDPFFHAGGYYVQDASCMLLETALKALLAERSAQSPLRVLDLCAAPGGKSTHLAQTLPPDALLISNEVVPARARILSENLSKWGRDRILVSQNQPSDFQALPFQFDFILVDAPCSGEGLFRKQPEAIQEWSEKQVHICRARQTEILQSIWPCLKAGGHLIYSTCTWNRSENEDVLLAFAEQTPLHFLPLDFPSAWGVQVSAELPLYRAWPHHIPGEGFSLALLQKDPHTPPANQPPQREKPLRLSTRKSKANSGQSTPPNAFTAQLTPWLKQAQNSDILFHDGHFWLWPAAEQAFLAAASNHLKLLNQGLCLAELKGQDLRPAPALALSAALNPQAFARQELDLPAALNYLRGESLPVSSHPQTGWILLEYAGLSLGWAKATPSHLNNAWPKAWKIRQAFLGQDIHENIAHFSCLKACSAPPQKQT